MLQVKYSDNPGLRCQIMQMKQLQKMKFEIPIAKDIDQILDRFRVYADSGKILD
mgnify:CR=1 FL=1